MEKTIFHNKLFEYVLIGFLLILMCWNIYALSTGNTMALLPLTVQSVVLVLIFIKHKHAKFAIYFLAGVIIFGNGLSFAAKIMKIMLGDEILMLPIINKAIFLIIGILIYGYAKKYVEVIKVPD